MRQIGTLPTEPEARTFADYLLTQDIRVNIEGDGGDWAIWVYDEDKVPDAKTELESFRENPREEKYTRAKSEADALRNREIQKQKAAKKQVKRASDRWNQTFMQRCPVTVTLIVLSVAAVMVTTYPDKPLEFGQKIEPGRTWLSLAPIRESGRPGYMSIPRNTFEAIFQGQVWRLFTPMFLHFGILHLLFNMMWLRDLGSAIEVRRGSWRFFGLVLIIAGLSNVAQGWIDGPAIASYFLSKLNAGLAFVQMDWQWLKRLTERVFYGIANGFRPGPSFGGMSGVVFGLFGYIWMQSRYVPSSGFFMPPNLVMLMLIYMVVCYTGLIGNIANTAHTLGLITGMIAGYSPKLWRDLTR